MAVRINTSEYKSIHGHTPKQHRFSPVSTWAFQIDQQQEPFFVIASYKTALKLAKASAQHTVTVLP